MRRFGFFTRLVGKPNTTNWFHFALPTPVIVNNDRKVLGPCMLRFQTGSTNAVVRDVYIYDGEVRIAAHDGVNLSGSQPFRRFGVAHAPLKVGRFVVAGPTRWRGSDRDRHAEPLGRPEVRQFDLVPSRNPRKIRP